MEQINPFKAAERVHDYAVDAEPHLLATFIVITCLASITVGYATLVIKKSFQTEHPTFFVVILSLIILGLFFLTIFAYLQYLIAW